MAKSEGEQQCPYCGSHNTYARATDYYCRDCGNSFGKHY